MPSPFFRDPPIHDVAAGPVAADRSATGDILRGAAERMADALMTRCERGPAVAKLGRMHADASPV